MNSGFDRLARPYRWMEYLSFGRSLERCRCHFSSRLTDVQHALLLGDGDGRFAADLLRHAPQATLLAVDASTAMLAALKRRCNATGSGHRVRTRCADLPAGLPAATGNLQYDLVTTHFFLDCLSEHECGCLASQLVPLLTKDARWIISEFHVPSNSFRVPARLLIGSLYFAFRMLTGLRTNRLPPYGAVLEKAGFRRVEQAFLLKGLLVSEMWALPPEQPEVVAA